MLHHRIGGQRDARQGGDRSQANQTDGYEVI
jgi:hypothetical protein